MSRRVEGIKERGIKGEAMHSDKLTRLYNLV